MELSPAVKAQFDRLEENFKRIDTLESDIKGLRAKEAGTADLEQKVEQISLDNAKAVEALKAELHERQDEFETKAKGPGSYAAGSGDFAATFTNSYTGSGLSAHARGKKAVVVGGGTLAVTVRVATRL